MFGIDDFLGMNHWLAATIVYIALALLTFIPVVIAKMNRVRLEPKEDESEVDDTKKDGSDPKDKPKKGWWERFKHRKDRKRVKDPFGTSTVFTTSEKKRLTNNFRRIEGALHYWRYRAEWNRRFHYYTLCWTLLISILIPVLLTFVTVEGYTQMFLIVISLHSAIMLGFHRMLKIENNYKAFKYGKSEFCDLYRRMLDRPESFGNDYDDKCEERDRNIWITNYFIEVETLRRSMRLEEIDSIPGTEDKGERNPLRKSS